MPAVNKDGTPRKVRGPSRPPIAAAASASVVDEIPSGSAGRRTRWGEYLNLARDNAGRWVKVGPFYRDTAAGARTRLMAERHTGLDVQVRNIDAEMSDVYLRFDPN
jgi:hypothetical protein